MNFKNFDWRVLKRYFSPQATNDLNDFLEKMPQTAGNTALIAAGIAWTAAAALGLYTAVQTQALIELRAELKETQALEPPVPKIRDVSVSGKAVEEFARELAGMYKGLEIKSQGAAILITARSTSLFGQFREAVGHVQNGGSEWRVSLERFCVGRECPKEQLGALLKINKVSVDTPS